MHRQFVAIARVPAFLGLIGLAAFAGWEVAEITGTPTPATAAERTATALPPATPPTVADPPPASAAAHPPGAAEAGGHPPSSVAWLVTGEGDAPPPAAPASAPLPPAPFRDPDAAGISLAWSLSGDPEPFSAPPPALLHLASYRFAANARRGWPVLVAQAEGLLDEAAPLLHPAELDRGRFLRLLAELPAGHDANAACAKLREKGMFCQLTKPPAQPLAQDTPRHPQWRS